MWSRLLWVFCACVLPMTSRAQSASGLELQAPVLGLTEQVFEWSLPTEAVGPIQQNMSVRETRHEIHVELPADILFDFDRSTIRPSATKALHQAADLIRTSSVGPVRVEGHTDAKGSPAYNQRLSESRAIAVRTWLVQKEGLKSVQFETAGFGARRPVAPDRAPDGSDNPVGRQRNRRVELVMQKP